MKNINRNVTDNEETIVKSGGHINEFLWLCAGVNRRVLRQCPTDYAKYAGIGGTILFTALMAMLSGGYALYTVFHNQFTAILFGIFWGLLIFNLDRFIVNTMYSDGKVTISRREFFSGLPRIIMAIFLGIVISMPLELKIFEDAIDIRIEQDKDELMTKKISNIVQERDSIGQKRDDVMNGVTLFDTNITTSSTENNNLLSDIDTLQKRLEIVKDEINSLDRKIDSENDALRRQKQHSSQRLKNLISDKNNRVSLKNSISASLRQKNGQLAASDNNLKKILEMKQQETNKESVRLQNAYDSLENIINEANIRHRDWTEKDIKEKGSFRDKLDVEYRGFQARMQAFSELKDESFSTWISSLFIMLLFITIETAPTFFKMMIASGPYDDLLRAEMHKAKVLADKRISDLNDEVNTLVQISTAKNKERLETEVVANKELMEKLAKAQAELLQNAIEKWKEDEMEKIAQDPSLYIKGNHQPDDN